MANGTKDYKLGQHGEAISRMDTRLERVEKKVDDLNVWRWKVVGALGMISAGSNLILELIFKTN